MGTDENNGQFLLLVDESSIGTTAQVKDKSSVINHRAYNA